MVQDVGVSIVRDIKNLISWVTTLEHSPWLAKARRTHSAFAALSIEPTVNGFVDMYLLEQCPDLNRGKVELLSRVHIVSFNLTISFPTI